MCWDSLLPRGRPELPNPDHRPTHPAEIAAPISDQPHQNESLQDLRITENLSPEGRSSISVTRSANDDEILLVNAEMLSRSSPGTSDPHSEWMKKLNKMLKAARVPCKDNRTFIIPPSELDRLITIPVIEREIKYEFPMMPSAEIRTHAQDIKESAKKMFALYALLNPGGASIRFLFNTDLCDEHFPLVKDGHPSRWSLSKRNHGGKVLAFDDWENDRVEEFDNWQWWMIAPFFNHHNQICLQLEDDKILPFTPVPESEGEQNDAIPHVKVGGYGEVTAYQIHPEYHNFPGWDKSLQKEDQPRIAVKRLLYNDRVEYLKERTILYALRPSNHPHLIQLLATYHQNKSFHFIFPCADANLRVYWRHHPEPEFNKERVLWSIKQIAGIADALYQIHKFRVEQPYSIEADFFTPNSGKNLKLLKGEEKYGRHGDIKAENLLWFRDENVVKITDFGLGRFHGRDSRSKVPWNSVTNPLSYEPPECTLGRYVSRRYDIWSMGCLVLEWFTWQLQGNDRIEKFADERGRPGENIEINDDNFFTAFSSAGGHKHAVVRDSVITWVEGLHATEKCSECVHDLLDFVMEHMLRVDPDERLSAEQFVEFMEKLVTTAEANYDYLVTPASRPTQIRHAIT